MAKLRGEAPLIVCSLLAVLAVCYGQHDVADKSKMIIMEEVEKIEAEMNAIQDNFDLLKKKLFLDKLTIANQWQQQGRNMEAVELINYAQVVALIESVKYAVSIKTLGLTRQMIGGQFIPYENGMVDTKTGVVFQAEMVRILVARAIARASIEADRQSQSNWRWLHKLIEYHLKVQVDPVFKKLAQEAYRELLRIRSRGRNLHERYYTIMKEGLETMQIDQAQAKPIVDGLDHLIETAIGCSKCSSFFPSAEYFQTRPLFENQDAVGEALSETMDPDFMAMFNSFDDEPNVHHVSLEEQNQVTRTEINNLMEEVIGSDNKKSKKSKSRN